MPHRKRHHAPSGSESSGFYLIRLSLVYVLSCERIGFHVVDVKSGMRSWPQKLISECTNSTHMAPYDQMILAC
jgi:hypothetical protein